MASLANKVFAITGGASGMGLATGRILAQAKARAICIGDFNDTQFETVRKELQTISPETDVHTFKLNVSSSESVTAWIAAIIEKYGALDGAVNAAGVAQQTGARKSPAILEETDDMWKRTIGVNLDGVFYCCREEIRAMTKLSKSPRSIVNIASLAALIHGPDCYGYGVSKSGVAYFTAGLAKDVLPHGIRVNCVSPGKCSYSLKSRFTDV